MVRRAFFVVCLISSGVGGAYAQVRHSVTNMDLERYRQQRVNAERELREDYTKLGFASPEELARRNAESQQQLIDLSRQLKSDRLERERLELERERVIQMSQPIVQQLPYGYGNGAVQPGDQFLPTVWGDGYGYGYGRYRGRGYQQGGYFAGGQFWPQGNQTPLRPLFVTPGPIVTPHRR